MPPRILMMESPLSDIPTAREIAPPGMELVVAPFGSDAFRAAIADADFLVGFGNKAIDAGFYAAAPKLKLFQLLSAGYDTVEHDEIVLPIESGKEVAEAVKVEEESWRNMTLIGPVCGLSRRF